MSAQWGTHGRGIAAFAVLSAVALALLAGCGGGDTRIEGSAAFSEAARGDATGGARAQVRFLPIEPLSADAVVALVNRWFLSLGPPIGYRRSQHYLCLDGADPEAELLQRLGVRPGSEWHSVRDGTLLCLHDVGPAEGESIELRLTVTSSTAANVTHVFTFRPAEITDADDLNVVSRVVSVELVISKERGHQWAPHGHGSPGS